MRHSSRFVFVRFVVGRGLGFFWMMALLAMGFVGCPEIQTKTGGDMLAEKPIITRMLAEMENDVWSLDNNSGADSESSIALGSWARSSVQAVRDMGASRIRVVFLEAQLNPLDERDYELVVSLLASQDGLSLVRFSERPTLLDGLGTANASKLTAFRWPKNWRVWEEAVVQVWNEMATPGRPLPNFAGRAEAASVIPDSLVDMIMPAQQDVEAERDAVRRWCARHAPDGCRVRAIPSALGLLAVTANDEPVARITINFGLRDGVGFNAYSAGLQDLRTKR